MSTIFTKETLGDVAVQDRGRLQELDKHELLRNEEGTENIASFDQVKFLGDWFLKQTFNQQLASNRPLPEGVLSRYQQSKKGAFLGKLALGSSLEEQFPVTIQPAQGAQGLDLRLQIVPIHFAALEKSAFGKRSDELLALAAAAAVAPQFIFALEEGIETRECSTKKSVVSSITPDHGTPLAVTFDAFQNTEATLQEAIRATGNSELSIRQAAHMHGQNPLNVGKITRAASDSRIAAGVKVLSRFRSELPKHVLFWSAKEDESTGQKEILSLQEALAQAGLAEVDLALLASALGFTAQVVGNSSREHQIEKILSPSYVELPLRDVIRS